MEWNVIHYIIILIVIFRISMCVQEGLKYLFLQCYLILLHVTQMALALEGRKVGQLMKYSKLTETNIFIIMTINANSAPSDKFHLFSSIGRTLKKLSLEYLEKVKCGPAKYGKSESLPI